MKKFSVKAIRVNLGLTQEEMAKELSISVRAYTDKENGKSKWSVINVQRKEGN